jgi:hypothetical protein
MRPRPERRTRLLPCARRLVSALYVTAPSQQANSSVSPSRVCNRRFGRNKSRHRSRQTPPCLPLSKVFQVALPISLIVGDAFHPCLGCPHCGFAPTLSVEMCGA